MKKKERLDQILLRLGHVDEQQIKQALERQRTRGGRVGTHLLYYNFITEDQLSEALAIQHGLPRFRADAHDVPPGVLDKLSAGSASELQVLPLGYEQKNRTVTVAAVNPADKTMIAKVKRAFRARRVEVYVAPESLLRRLIDRHYRAGAAPVRDGFAAWLQGRTIPTLQAEASALGDVSAVLDNPAPYKRVARSLIRALQIVAELRCAEAAWVPPYPLIRKDVERLARALGLGRLAADGLQIAALLLVPADSPKGRAAIGGPGSVRFSDVERSIEYAGALHFPWDIAAALRHTLDIFSGKRAPAADAPTRPDRHEASLAAEILSVVWYHRAGENGRAPSGKLASPGERLRAARGRLAAPDVVDAYIRLIELNGGGPEADVHSQVFIVSRKEELAAQFSDRLGRAGFRTVQINDIDEAQRMCERHAPAAILIDNESYLDRIFRLGHLFKLNSVVLLCAFTRERDPALTLDLLDAGFDDVFTPPFDFELIAMSISRSLRGLSRENRGETAAGFSATFKAFSLIDLLQSLGQSAKTVRIHLTNHAGSSAEVFMKRGKMVRATCGTLQGAPAIYEAIRWGDDGAFTVEPETSPPKPNISEPNEAILMEACRLLDESRAESFQPTG